MIHEKVSSYFRQKYNTDPILIKAPGRINLIGEHTDYNDGFVLPAAIKKGIYFAVAPSSANHIQIETFLTQPEIISFDFKGRHQPFQSFWGNYFKAILEILAERKYPFKGMDCVFGGDIPIGSGLSSSAALCCGFIFAITQISGAELSRKEIALIAQEAEHKIGLNCGIMDQYAVLFGKKGNALFLDCRDLSHEYIPINLTGYQWVLVNSNIKHNLAVDSEYNKRRVSCENVVKKVQEHKAEATSLRDVTLEDIERNSNTLDKLDVQRARYVLEENIRVKQMIKSLSNGKADEVGSILRSGHWAMSKEYEITTSELDFLVSSGETIEGIIGSRMMGGGFGGCTINLVKSETVEKSIAELLSAYKTKTGIDAEYYHLAIDDGVALFES